MKYPLLKALAILLFALSGISGLIYEICWSKYLSLFIGSTAYSHMIVLSTFMAGLALGAFFWGRTADRVDNPLKLYGLLELGIGLYCALYPFLMSLCEKVFVSAAGGLILSTNHLGLTFLKLALSAATLLLPTFAMGGTLPVLLRLLARTVDESGRQLAALYAVNSLGAVIGAALAGFFLIRVIALDATTWLAAGINILVGVIALSLPRIQSAPQAQTASLEAEAQSVPSTVRLALIVAGLSGLIAMIYELTWIRLLVTLLGSSTYSFTLMLIAFISGITLGSWIVAKISRRVKNLVRFLALCQIGTTLFMLGTLPLYSRLPYYLWRLSAYLSNKPENFPIFLFCEFLFCFLLMIVPTTLSGMSLPVAGRITAGSLSSLGKSIGGVFSLNTIGAVAGALLTGFVLIPMLGVKQSLESAMLINALLGIVLLGYDRRLRPGWKVAAAAGLLLLGITYKLTIPKWNENVSALGVYRAFFLAAPESYDAFLKGIEYRTTLWYREGITANVAVDQFSNDLGEAERSLVVNGKADASTRADLPTQVLLAQIPLSIRPDTGNVLVIGLGSGITAGSALCHPIRSLDCVEISPEVVDCNYLFSEHNHNFLADPRAHLTIEDAITFVKVNPKKYSVIISEPSNPWIAGIGNLFTDEFFDLMKRRLEPGGILAQWFHLYEINDDVLHLVLRTLRRTFPHVMIWMPTDLDIVLTASMTPISPDYERMDQKIRIPKVAVELNRIKIYDLPAFLSTQLSGDLTSASVPATGGINSEKQPLLEFLAPISFFAQSRAGVINSLDRRFSPGDTDLFFSRLNRERPLNAGNFLNVARFQSSVVSEDYRLTFNSARECLRRNPDDPEALAIFATAAKAMNDTAERLSSLEHLATLTPDNTALLSTLATELFECDQQKSGVTQKDLEVPIQLLQRCIDLTNRQDETFFIKLAPVFTAAARFDEAAEAYASALTLRATYQPVDEEITDDQLAYLTAENYLDGNHPELAKSYIERLRELNPQHSALPDLESRLSMERKGTL